MKASAYAMAAPAGELRVWLGLYDVAGPAPPSPSLVITGPGSLDAKVMHAPPQLTPIGDGSAYDGNTPRHFRCILRVTGLQPGERYEVNVTGIPAACEPIRVRCLPLELPTAAQGGFNILLCSCYSGPQDAGGLVGTIAREIKRPVDMVLMLGDQIYGDLPVSEDLPSNDAGVADVLHDKYRRNFASSTLGVAGLASVLARGPALCLADDHEYWNNYPARQAQLPKTWTESGRYQWQDIARRLYEDYQLDGQAGGAMRMDIGPLSILTVDMRSQRDASNLDLVSPATLASIQQWAGDLKQRRTEGRPAFGLLASGQALLRDPAGWMASNVVDAEMSNYRQFREHLLPALESLSAASIPVLYVTGDVHWSRVARARDRESRFTTLYEVIVSPSCLIRSPGDGFKLAKDALGGLFGSRDPWPRHGCPDGLPGAPRFLKGRFEPFPGRDDKKPFELRGDRLAILSLAQSGGGIDAQVTYYGVTEDKAESKSESTPLYTLRNL